MSDLSSILDQLPLLTVKNRVLLPGCQFRISVSRPASVRLVTEWLWRSEGARALVGIIPVIASVQPSRSEAEAKKSDSSPASPSPSMLPGLIDESSVDSALEPHFSIPVLKSESGPRALAQEIGTIGKVIRLARIKSGPKLSYTILVEGQCRFKVESVLQSDPFIMVKAKQLEHIDHKVSQPLNDSAERLEKEIRESCRKFIKLLSVRVPRMALMEDLLDDTSVRRLVDMFISTIDTTFEERLQVLRESDLTTRFAFALSLIQRQVEILTESMKRQPGPQSAKTPALDLAKKTADSDSLQDSSSWNTEPPKDREEQEVDELEKRVKAHTLSPEVTAHVAREFSRLRRMNTHSSEYYVLFNYLEWIADLPWNKGTTDVLDLEKARRDLDNDHYGLTKIKKRILEFFAVRKLRNDMRGPILCLVGPPGVGKTSLGRSIASTLGRKFHRISLGGVHDEAEIRGHRLTYVGALPGRIIQAMRKVGSNNPVILLDEIDKLGRDMRGDPASALLEVLDPEQNSHFSDHYLHVPFDLSKVLFICTANKASTIMPALLDRMEVIEISGYTLEEKANIAMRHLIPKQLKEHGISSEFLEIPKEIIFTIGNKYTREAGVRNLEREIASVCRAAAVKMVESAVADDKSAAAESKPDGPQRGSATPDVEVTTLKLNPSMQKLVVDEKMLEDILGLPKFEDEIAERVTVPGVATGLVWTAHGGSIMFVEATRMGGKGKLMLTGQLGDVIKESAQIALTWVKAHAGDLKQTATDLARGGADVRGLLEDADIHIHFPAGAIPKDGPSAGVTLITVMVSLVSDKCVRADTAMTGEVTLSGVVLPIGGVKEKVLAAHRAGIKRVILPQRNAKDLQEVPENVRTAMEFIFAKTVDDVLAAAFEGGSPIVPRPRSRL